MPKILSIQDIPHEFSEMLPRYDTPWYPWERLWKFQDVGDEKHVTTLTYCLHWIISLIRYMMLYRNSFFRHIEQESLPSTVVNNSTLSSADGPVSTFWLFITTPCHCGRYFRGYISLVSSVSCKSDCWIAAEAKLVDHSVASLTKCVADKGWVESAMRIFFKIFQIYPVMVICIFWVDGTHDQPFLYLQ